MKMVKEHVANEAGPVPYIILFFSVLSLSDLTVLTLTVSDAVTSQPAVLGEDTDAVTSPDRETTLSSDTTYVPALSKNR